MKLPPGYDVLSPILRYGVPDSAALQSTIPIKVRVYTSDPNPTFKGGQSLPASASIGEATSVITVVQSISATVTLTPNPAQAQKGQLIDLTASVQDPPTKTLYYEWIVNGVKLPPGYDVLSPILRYGVPNSAALQSTIPIKVRVYTSDPNPTFKGGQSLPASASIGEATSVITVVQSISATVTLTPNPAQAQKGQLIDLTASVQDPPTKTLYYEWTVNGVKLPPGYDVLSPILRYGVPNSAAPPKYHPYKSKSIHQRSEPHV